MKLHSYDHIALAASRYAFKYGFLNLVRRVVTIESDDNIKLHYSFALRACVVQNWLDMAKQLIRRGVDVKSAGTLFVASREENVKFVKMLVQNGADPNIESCESESSALKGSRVVVKRLTLSAYPLWLWI